MQVLQLTVQSDLKNTHHPLYLKKKKASQISQLISFTSLWIQWAGGWAVCFTASSSIPSRSNRPGLEHIENPPTTDTPGIKKSTLKIDQTQKFKKEANNPKYGQQ